MPAGRRRILGRCEYDPADPFIRRGFGCSSAGRTVNGGSSRQSVASFGWVASSTCAAGDGSHRCGLLDGRDGPDHRRPLAFRRRFGALRDRRPGNEPHPTRRARVVRCPSRTPPADESCGWPDRESPGHPVDDLPIQPAVRDHDIRQLDHGGSDGSAARLQSQHRLVRAEHVRRVQVLCAGRSRGARQLSTDRAHSRRRLSDSARLLDE